MKLFLAGTAVSVDQEPRAPAAVGTGPGEPGAAAAPAASLCGVVQGLICSARIPVTSNEPLAEADGSI